MAKNILITIILLSFFISCSENLEKKDSYNSNITKNPVTIVDVKLDTDLSKFSDSQKELVKKFIKISEFIDSIFMYENAGKYATLYNSITAPDIKKKFICNFGPWDIFDNNKPFIENVENKPLGANFYPSDLTKTEFNNLKDKQKLSHYTFVRKNEIGELQVVPYHVELKKFIDTISALLNNAASIIPEEQFSIYLKEKSLALQTDNYYKSDSIWLHLPDNHIIDFIVGPTLVLNDKLFNLKSEHQAFVLLKNTEWTSKTKKYNKWLKYLQKALPVPEEYRAEEPGKKSAIAVYDALYYGGSANYGGAEITVIYPFDTKVQLEQGVKNIQLRNVMFSKFNTVLKPIANVILSDEQKKLVSEKSFFMNKILYEMGNSLGIKNTINKQGTVRETLKDLYLVSNYIKNYATSLFLAEKIAEVDDNTQNIEENYITFVVDLLRLIRFGTSSDYAVANLIVFNYLVEKKAITYDNKVIEVNIEKTKTVIQSLMTQMIVIQGDGNYQLFNDFYKSYNKIGSNIQEIINSINNKNIPTDIAIVQGKDVLNI